MHILLTHVNNNDSVCIVYLLSVLSVTIPIHNCLLRVMIKVALKLMVLYIIDAFPCYHYYSNYVINHISRNIGEHYRRFAKKMLLAGY